MNLYSTKSGLQKQVLSLYRKLLRNSFTKDQKVKKNTSLIECLKDSESSIYAVREKFRVKAAGVSKRDIERIEYNIRVGEKYVKQLRMDGVVAMKRT